MAEFGSVLLSVTLFRHGRMGKPRFVAVKGPTRQAGRRPHRRDRRLKRVSSSATTLPPPPGFPATRRVTSRQ